jgi:RND superfamily putative drug exporter
VTGSVITACGIILAGTFGVLAISPIRTLMQIGLAVSLGVLIDTFVVRALLVPAIAARMGRWSWWPSKLEPTARKIAPEQPKDTVPDSRPRGVTTRGYQKRLSDSRRQV